MSEFAKISKNDTIKILAKILIVFFLLAAVFYWASGEQLFFLNEEETSITPKYTAAVMDEGTKVEFTIQPKADYLDSIAPLIGTYGRENEGYLLFQVFAEDGRLLSETQLPTRDLKDYVNQNVVFDTPIGNVKGERLTVAVTACDVPAGQAVSMWYGTDINTGKFSIPDMNGNTFSVNGVVTDGKICYTASGRNILWIGHWYWWIVLGIGLLLTLGTLYTVRTMNREKDTLIGGGIALVKRYSFLVRQLVTRDFKRKYKRSVLGVLWSFLNPLLTMLVQYFVFSTIFKSTIDNFIVYLLSGIILFNFFGESVSLGLSSIVDNAHLITKVYMPKEIYPLSRVLSSLINLVLSLVPLFAVMLLTGVPFTKSMFLIPIVVLCMIFFCVGMSLLLSTSMVFFQDTMFLWSVLSTLWNYLTPTFYPVSIIPEKWLPIYKLNPMYQYITFLRSILLDGKAPSPELYAGCILSAGVVFALGLVVFRKNQNKFVLHL